MLVCDSLGVGGAPDADTFGDAGSDTLGHTAAAVGGLDLPVLGRMGLGQLTRVAGVPPTDHRDGAVTALAERSAAKDTTTGHWELMGLVTEHPSPTYPEGFPPEVINAFNQATGRGVLGNEAASGTEIIARLGDRHVATGDPIVYTSADSVFQVAAHIDVVPLKQLYAWCEAARAQLTGVHAVGRVIARPFAGPAGAYTRTTDRHDYALLPPGPTVLEALQAARVRVLGVGKIEDIFSWRGLDDSRHTGDNDRSLDAAAEFLREADPAGPPTFLFVNLVDFDMLHGHRRDPHGYARALEHLDRRLPELQQLLGPDDWLLLTGDHGCDPTAPGTDHTRERVPFICWSPGGTSGRVLPDRPTMADAGATVADLLGVPVPPGPGTSLADLIHTGEA